MLLGAEGEHVGIGHVVVGDHQAVFGNETSGAHEIDGHNGLGHSLDGRFCGVNHPHAFICPEIGRKKESDKNE